MLQPEQYANPLVEAQSHAVGPSRNEKVVGSTLRQAKARAEVTADAATQAGQVRHGMRYLRVRAELRPEDLPALPGREVL